MTPQDFQTFLHLQQRAIEAVTRIAIALEQMMPAQAAPNYQLALKDFPTFNWASIGAVVERSDSDGPTAICWKNNTYLRRSPSNKFGAAIWFSRCVGKDAQGANIYERLITFKEMSEAEPLPQKVTSDRQLGR